jgi:hypothetical protein
MDYHYPKAKAVLKPISDLPVIDRPIVTERPVPSLLHGSLNKLFSL